MFIKLNKNTLYVNFNKHKREYVVIPMGHLKLNRNQFVYNTIAWNINTKIFKQNGIQKENYNLKIENENIPTKPITIKTKIKE